MEFFCLEFEHRRLLGVQVSLVFELVFEDADLFGLLVESGRVELGAFPLTGIRTIPAIKEEPVPVEPGRPARQPVPCHTEP